MKNTIHNSLEVMYDLVIILNNNEMEKNFLMVYKKYNKYLNILQINTK